MLIGLIVGAVVLIVVIFLVARGFQTGRFGSGGATTGAAPDAVVQADRPRPDVADFHVRGEVARVSFAVPLPPGEPDQALVDLLVGEAVEVVREKRHELPIDQVTTVVALGRRNGDDVEVGSVGLETPGELPPPMMPEHLVRASQVDYDPIGEFAQQIPASAPELAATTPGETLGAIGGEIRLVGGLEAGLRAQGVDPATMTAGDLVVGVLRLSGHRLAPGADDSTFTAEKAGVRTMIRVVDHEAGEYPELGEQAIDGFIFDFASSGAARGLLVTDKYSPFSVYERERRDQRVRFLSRERLQHFVDAAALS